MTSPVSIHDPYRDALHEINVRIPEQFYDTTNRDLDAILRALEAYEQDYTAFVGENIRLQETLDVANKTIDQLEEDLEGPKDLFYWVEHFITKGIFIGIGVAIGAILWS